MDNAHPYTRWKQRPMTFRTSPRRPVYFCLFLFLVMGGMLVRTYTAFAWGGGHSSITQAALAALPPWQKDLLGKELALLGREYCIIPDMVFTKKEMAKYAMMDTKPNQVYLVDLHLPPAPTEACEILRYFMGKAVEQFKAGRVDEGARYLGTLAHALEDWGCPAHSVPGDNMFTLMKQFLPPTEEYRFTPMHGPMENGRFTVDLGDYRPRLLGTSVDEAAFNLLQEVQQSTIHARAQVIPIMQALYAGDEAASNAAQQKAGRVDAMVVADAVHTVLSLAREQFDEESVAALQQVDLSIRIPLEAPNLAMPQSAFFSKPYWGHATRGVTLREGKIPVPIRLKTPDNILDDEPIEEAIAVGTTATLTYLVPPGVYDRLEVWAGLHAELGTAGEVVFQIRGSDGKALATAQVRGDQPAHRLTVPLAGQSSIQLVTTAASPASTSNYAVWGRPQLLKPEK